MMPRRSGQRRLACARAMVEKAGGRGADRRDRDHQPARDDRLLDRGGPASRWRGRSSGRTGARRISAPGSRRRATSRRCRRRPGCCSTPISRRSKIAWAMRQLAAAARGGRRSRDRHGRNLAGLQADRRPARLRRDQRLAHRADGHPRRAAGTTGCSTCSACRAAALPEIVDCAGPLWRDDRSVRRADPDLRHGRRPAGGGDRPGLLRARRDQGDLRHRRLRPHPHRRRRRRSRATGC